VEIKMTEYIIGLIALTIIVVITIIIARIVIWIDENFGSKAEIASLIVIAILVYTLAYFLLA
jgi:hypothetical protein